ncbi:hypothetical protein [Pimelobacter sp. 30-1]|uniref:hypothetical protein n=1 Tax=Pimelobacter sp. 30-1 TaxID=2004991 RepID=UPI001C0498C8|nr:hypothetical protein [Pimelobacter sp. 30-1]MBU2693576.1 hypothetical protein [Pimelobacter sp. 30-1]
MRTALLAGVVAAGLAAAGCGGADRTASDPAAENGALLSGAPFADVSEIVLPLDDYLLNGAELRAVARARTGLVDECVLRFTQESYVEVAVGVTPAFSPYRFGLVGTTSAARWGYHDPDDELSESFARAHPVRTPPGTPTAAHLLDGRLPIGSERPLDPGGKTLPKDGCVGDAEAFLGGPVAESGFVSRAVTEIEEAERTDPRVQDAISDWVACMTDTGHDYANPLDPVVELGGAAAITPEERAVAIADAACRASTSYVERRVAILAELQERSLAADQGRWDAYRADQQDRLHKARGYLDLVAASGEAEEAAS